MLSVILLASILFVAVVSGGGWNIPFQSLLSALSSLALISVAVYYFYYKKKDVADEKEVDGRKDSIYGKGSGHLSYSYSGFFSYAAGYAAFFVFIVYLLASYKFVQQGKSPSVFYEAMNWATYFAVYLASVLLRNEHKEKIFESVVWSAAFAAAFFVVQKFFSATPPSDYTTWGLLPKKNVFNSVALAGILIFSVGKITKRISSRSVVSRDKEFYTLLCFILLVLSAVLSMSVSNLIGFFATLGLLLFVVFPTGNKSYIKWRKVTICAIAVALALAIVIKLREPKVFDRVVWYKAALAMFLDKPFTGVGAGRFGAASLDYIKATAGNGEILRSHYAHSFYLEMLAETGLVGFTLLVTAFYFAIKNSDDVRARLVAVFFLVSATTDFIFNFPVIPLILFALLGAGTQTNPFSHLPYSTDSVTKRGKMIFALIVLYSLFLFVGGIVKYNLWSREYKKEMWTREVYLHNSVGKMESEDNISF